MIEDHIAGIPASYLRPRGRYLYRRTTYTNQILEDVSIVITSGALYNLKAYPKIDPFRDDFFIDYVDIEYCLRAKQNGYNIVVNCNARLYHRLGNQQTRMAGPFTMHPPFIRYCAGIILAGIVFQCIGYMLFDSLIGFFMS